MKIGGLDFAWTSGVCVGFGSGEQKITRPLFLLSSLPPPIVLASCCVILSLPLTLLFTTGIQVFGFGVLLVVLRGARCTFVLLSGPVWALLGGAHQPKEPGQFYCPAAFQSKKPTVRRVSGRGWGGHGWRSGLNVTADCHRSSPALSRSVLPLEKPRGRQMHLPEIHTPGPDAYPPQLQGFTEMLHVPHTGVHLHSFKRAQRDIGLYPTSPWSFEPNVNLKKQHRSLKSPPWKTRSPQTPHTSKSPRPRTALLLLNLCTPLTSQITVSALSLALLCCFEHQRKSAMVCLDEQIGISAGFTVHVKTHDQADVHACACVCV